MTPDPISALCEILRGESTVLPPGDEGDRVIRLAREHRVHCLLASRLTNVPDALARPVRTEALLADLSDRDLARAIAALDVADIAPIVFKGAALAYTHYAEPWHRPRVDADLLIPADRRQQAFDVLRGLGYERPPFVSGELLIHQAPFVRTDRLGIEHALDVHWRIANAQAIANTLTYDQIANAAGSVIVQDVRVRVPSPAHALLLACVHRATHHNDSEELLWLFDLHLVSERLQPGEWNAFVDVAVAGAVRAICARGLTLAAARFGTAIPEDVLGRLAAPAAGRKVELSSVYLRKDLREIDRLLVDVRALGAREGARLICEHLFPPASYIRQAYGGAGAAPLPALYAFRILAGVKKWLRPRRPNLV